MNSNAAVQMSFPSLQRRYRETLAIRYRLLIIEDHALFREGLGHFFRACPDCAGLFEAGDFEEAFELIRQHPIDIVFLDCDLERQSAFLFLNRLVDAEIAVRVLLLAGEENSSGLRELLRAGSVGVVSKQCSAEDVHQAIRAAMQGKTWRNSRLLRQSDLMNASFGLSQRTLTPRQMQVLKGILEGRANKEIAANLGVSETSVKCTVRQLFAKTETHCRGQLIRVLLERLPASGTPG
jgi:DNA-binding NarL/FixJ family response regulator